MKRLALLLNKGLEIKGTYSNVKKVLDIDEYEGVRHFTESDSIKATIDIDTFDERKIFNFKDTFIDVNFDFVVAVNPMDGITSDGKMVKLIDLISKVKRTQDDLSYSKGDLVRLVNCDFGAVLFGMETIDLKERYCCDLGVIRHYDSNKDAYMVYVGDKAIKLPASALEPVFDFFDNRIAKMVKHMNNAGKYFLTSKDYNYLSITEDGNYIQYINRDRLDRFEGDYWNQELRDKYAVKKKIRGVIQSIFSECSAGLCDTLIALYSGAKIDIKIIEGEAIRQVFYTKNCSDSGNISRSCMRNTYSGNWSADWFDIYVDNAKCAILKDKEGKIILRAMLWEMEDLETGEKKGFMDRIYSSDDSLVPAMKAWANEHGYCFLEEQTYGQMNAMGDGGERVDLRKYGIRIKKGKYNSYPYMDTFKYICGFCLLVGENVYKLRSTSGESNRVL